MSDNLQKKVSICISKRTDSGSPDGEDTDLITEGSFYIKDGAFYIIYKESEVSGLEGTTTCIKVKNDTVILTRFGALSSRMTFKPGEKDFSLYRTQYGTFNMSALTHSTKVSLNEKGGNLFIYYTLDIEGLVEAENVKLMINIREVDG